MTLYGWTLAALLLTAAAAAMAADNEEGGEIYKQICANCHAVGIPGPAPKIGVRAEWDLRLVAGRPALLRSVLYGKGAMPPKGGNASITNEQAGAALDYMLLKLGNANPLLNMPGMPAARNLPNMPAIRGMEDMRR